MYEIALFGASDVASQLCFCLEGNLAVSLCSCSTPNADLITQCVQNIFSSLSFTRCFHVEFYLRTHKSALWTNS